MRIGRFRVDTGPGSRYSPMTVRQIGMLLATIGIATLVTWLLAPIVGRAVFVLVYASVAVSAAVAGVRGGVVALLIGLLLIQYIAIPGHRRAALQYPHDLFSLITFVLVSVLLIALTRSMRRIRRRMGIANADLEVANTELERTNAELARTLDEANRAREDAIVQADRLSAFLLNRSSDLRLRGDDCHDRASRRTGVRRLVQRRHSDRRRDQATRVGVR